ncbi:MAG: hypothetical protein PHC51_12115 [bacterium]|nr:hypothetical protein [bacterium]
MKQSLLKIVAKKFRRRRLSIEQQMKIAAAYDGELGPFAEREVERLGRENLLVGRELREICDLRRELRRAWIADERAMPRKLNVWAAIESQLEDSAVSPWAKALQVVKEGVYQLQQPRVYLPAFGGAVACSLTIYILAFGPGGQTAENLVSTGFGGDVRNEQVTNLGQPEEPRLNDNLYASKSLESSPVDVYNVDYPGDLAGEEQLQRYFDASTAHYANEVVVQEPKRFFSTVKYRHNQPGFFSYARPGQRQEMVVSSSSEVPLVWASNSWSSRSLR